MNRRTIVIGIAGLAALAFAGGAFFLPKLSASDGPAEDILIRDHSPTMGPVNAPVTIVEFLDPSCEACRAFYPIVKQIMATAPDRIRLVIRYAPLHEGSDEVVRILEAARVQDKFQPVLEKLFAEQDSWAMHGAPDLNKAWALAGEAGLDLDRARKDAVAAAVDAVLEQDLADVRAIELQATPTFFVNGKPLPSFGPQQLYELVVAELAVAEIPTGTR